MAMGNLSSKSVKLFIGDTLQPRLAVVVGNVTVNQVDDGFNSIGAWVGGSMYHVDSNGNYTNNTVSETDYIDIGYVTDERDEVSIGGIGISLPGTGADNRIFWAVGGKTVRVTISGIIPDGLYYDISGGSLMGLSNSSVFKYKMNKYIAYQATSLSNLFPHIVHYRRRYVNESVDGGTIRYVIVNYSSSFIEGSRHLKYSISLDMAGNVSVPTNYGPSSIFAKGMGLI